MNIPISDVYKQAMKGLEALYYDSIADIDKLEKIIEEKDKEIIDLEKQLGL